MTADDRVQQAIAEAARRRAANQARRRRYEAARQHGIAARHHLKLKRLQQHENQQDEDPNPEVATHGRP